jgi:hypothetical protein
MKKWICKIIINLDYKSININNTYGKWKPYVDLKIYDENNMNYKIGCGPWKLDKIFYIFCQFDDTIPERKHFFEFKENENKFNFSGMK